MPSGIREGGPGLRGERRRLHPGPLLAGFLLLPQVGERFSLVTLTLPLFALAPLAAPGIDERRRFPLTRGSGLLAVGLVGCAVAVYATTATTRRSSPNGKSSATTRPR